MITKRFNLNEILDSMPTAPHTLEVSQYKRGIGDIAFTYKAHFKIETKLEKIGKETAGIVTELKKREILTKKIDFSWLHEKNHKFIEAGSAVEVSVVVELKIPAQLAQAAADDENFTEGLREYFNEKKTVEGSVVE